MLAYTADPGRFGGDDEAIENVRVTDYETGALIDGQECCYVRINDSDHVNDIMTMNPTSFAEREAAEASIDDLNGEFDTDYEHEADVITFDEFDMELALLYRGRFFRSDDSNHDH